MEKLMSDAAGGLGALVVIILVLLVPILLSRHRRPPAEVVTTGSAQGRAGMSIHPWRGHQATTAAAWVVTAAVLALGLWFLGSSLYAAAFLLVAALVMAYLLWSRMTGRAGDGTLTFTPEGLHQLYAGSEVFVPWEDVRGLVTTPTDFIVETNRPISPLHHMLPFMGRRKVVRDDAISLPRRNLPPLPYQEMVELYSTSPVARDELGTEEAVTRARGMLAVAR
jgi:hypothetical protein